MSRTRAIGITLVVATVIVTGVFVLLGVGLGDAEGQMLPAPFEVHLYDGWNGPVEDTPLDGPIDGPHTPDVPGIGGPFEGAEGTIDLAVYLPLALAFTVGAVMLIRAKPSATAPATDNREHRDPDDDASSDASPPPLPDRHAEE